MLGLGNPGNSMESPSQHLELGFDMIFSESLRFGPFYQIVSATKRESLSFAASGYQEVRTSTVNASVLGGQVRWLINPQWSFRVGVGVSQTTLRVKSVDTDAPVASTAEGYSYKAPSGFGLQTLVERSWPTKSGQIGAAVGMNVTSVTSNDSFAEMYLALVIRFGLEKQSKNLPISPTPSGWYDKPNIPMER